MATPDFRRVQISEPVMRCIPEGWLTMGCDAGRDDEKPAHRVWVDAFELAAFQTTNADYAGFLQDTRHPSPLLWDDSSFGNPQQPVVAVSWFDAVAYCEWLSRTHGKKYRLPTEAEWERAARGGMDGAAFPWGDDIPSWIPGGGRGPRLAPWPVTLGPPTPYGLFGIAANVHEWCADWHAADYYASSPADNPAGPPSGRRRASRGGSWRHAVTISRCAARSKIDPSFRYTDYGFRTARSL